MPIFGTNTRWALYLAGIELVKGQDAQGTNGTAIES